jgi:hypothetical protein
MSTQASHAALMAAVVAAAAAAVLLLLLLPLLGAAAGGAVTARWVTPGSGSRMVPWNGMKEKCTQRQRTVRNWYY